MENGDIHLKTFGEPGDDSDPLVQQNSSSSDRTYSSIRHQNHIATRKNELKGRMNPFDSNGSVSKYQPYDERELIRVYEKPRDWTLRAFLSCLICFCPTGIVALMIATQAKTAVSIGNLKEAHRKASLARLWTRATLLIGLIFYIVVILTFILVKVLDSH